jgi:hypothetical protein
MSILFNKQDETYNEIFIDKDTTQILLDKNLNKPKKRGRKKGNQSVNYYRDTLNNIIEYLVITYPNLNIVGDVNDLVRNIKCLEENIGIVLPKKRGRKKKIKYVNEEYETTMEDFLEKTFQSKLIKLDKMSEDEFFNEVVEGWKIYCDGIRDPYAYDIIHLENRTTIYKDNYNFLFDENRRPLGIFINNEYKIRDINEENKKMEKIEKTIELLKY